MTDALAGHAAFELDEQIHLCNYHIRANFLKMAELLVKMRDEKHYKSLDCPTFGYYLGTLGAEGTRGWLYKLIRAYETFKVRLGVDGTRLIEVGPTKLDIIAPVVTAENKDEWLGKAAAWSKSDVISEVRAAQGKPPLSPLPAHRVDAPPDLLKYKTYLDYVRDNPCLVCGEAAEPHHWPVTRGAGGKEVEEWAIPLCRGCHDEAHRNPHKFMHDYSHHWARYFYGLILRHWGRDE